MNCFDALAKLGDVIYVTSVFRQCERMRLKLEQKNNRKKSKEPPKAPSIVRELHCANTGTLLLSLDTLSAVHFKHINCTS